MQFIQMTTQWEIYSFISIKKKKNVLDLWIFSSAQKAGTQSLSVSQVLV